MKTTLFAEFMSGVKEAPKLYFAPLVAVFKAVRSVWHRIATPKPSRHDALGPRQGKQNP
jgi:hypothetical protein